MKGWLDNFGKADNANESNVSLPEDFVGLAYNTKGRNYSPASFYSCIQKHHFEQLE